MLGGSHLNGFVPMWKVKERAKAQRAPDEGSTGTGTYVLCPTAEH